MSPVLHGALLQPVPFLPGPAKALLLSFQVYCTFRTCYSHSVGVMDLLISTETHLLHSTGAGQHRAEPSATVSDLSLRNGFFCDVEIYTYIKKE